MKLWKNEIIDFKEKRKCKKKEVVEEEKKLSWDSNPGSIVC